MDQLTLSFEPGLAARYRSLRECIAAGVYRIGLQRVASKIDTAPSNLSASLSDKSKRRKFGVDDLELYYNAFGDLEPIYYQIDRWLKGQDATSKEHLLAKADVLMSEFRNVVTELRAAK